MDRFAHLRSAAGIAPDARSAVRRDRRRGGLMLHQSRCPATNSNANFVAVSLRSGRGLPSRHFRSDVSAYVLRVRGFGPYRSPQRRYTCQAAAA